MLVNEWLQQKTKINLYFRELFVFISLKDMLLRDTKWMQMYGKGKATFISEADITVLQAVRRDCCG